MIWSLLYMASRAGFGPRKFVRSTVRVLQSKKEVAARAGRGNQIGLGRGLQVRAHGEVHSLEVAREALGGVRRKNIRGLVPRPNSENVAATSEWIARHARLLQMPLEHLVGRLRLGQARLGLIKLRA